MEKFIECKNIKALIKKVLSLFLIFILLTNVFIITPFSAEALSVTLHVWISDSAMGDVPDNYYVRNSYYLCYELIDSNGTRIDSLGNYSYTVTETMYEVDGSVAHTYKYNNDHSWIAIRRSQAGKYRGVVTVTGDIGLTCEVHYTTKYNASLSSSKSSISLNLDGTNSSTLRVTPSGAYPGKISMSKSYDSSIVNIEFKEWDGMVAVYSVTGVSSGSTNAVFSLKENYTEDKMLVATITVPITVSDTIKPTTSISSTNNVATSQTVTLSLSDSVGVTSYYWGTSSSPSSSSYTSITSTTSTTITKTVSSSGIYYLLAKDNAGNVSISKSITFYKTALNANGGTVSQTTVLTKSGNSFTPPTPTRTGYTFAGWSTSSTATTGSTSITPTSNTTYYAIWKDSTNPSCSISSTNNVASSQTVTLSLSDNAGIAGYYWGTSSSYSSNTFTSTSSTSITKTISSSGTYYLTAKDSSGNVSTTKSITFYKTTLNANGGTVSQTTVLTKSGNSFTPPTPTRTGYTFAGWSTSSTATTGSTSITPTSNITYYAVWKDATNPSCSISSTNNVASSQTVTLSLSDNAGIAGYYWGTSLSYSNNDFSSISSTSITKTVSEPGTYYLTAKDSSGNVSTTQSITFYQTTLNANGGTVSQNTVLTKSGNSFTPPTPTKTGFTFAGWSTSSTATTGSTSITPTSNTTYYAVWRDATNPSCSISSTNNVASSQTVTLTLSDNVGIAGYYWGTSSSYSNNTFSSISSTSITKSISSSGTYYLTVKDTSGNVSTTQSITFYNTTLNANGGTLASGAPSYVLTASGNTFTPTVPTRSGYTFAGWSTSSTATTGSTSITPTSNTTYYAIWKDSTNPSCSISSTNNVDSSQTVTLSLSDNAGIAGYYWGTSSSYSNNTFSSTSSTSITKSISSSGTYYLTVKDTSGNVSTTKSITFYKTTLNANGGTVAQTTVLTKSGNSFTPPTPTRSGYTFVGWNTSSTATTGSTSITPTSNTTYYAVWKDATNPSCSISSTNNVASSQTVTLSLSDNAGIAGYYWGTNSNYSNNTFSSISSTSITKTISSPGTYYLTAKDTSGNVSTTQSITFYQTTLNANGGTVSQNTVLTKSGNSFTPPTPTRSGYTFVGWSTSSTATTGSTSITPTSNTTYYAVWEKIEVPTTAPTTQPTTETTEITEPTTLATEPVETTQPTTETEPVESTEPTTEPTPVFDYYVVGDKILFGADWTETPANGMTKGIDDLYYLSINNAPAGTFKFKVKDSNGRWYPDGMGNDGVVTTTGGEKVIFRYDPKEGYAVVSTDGKIPTYPTPTTQPTTVVTEPMESTAPTTETTAPTEPTETIRPTTVPTTQPTTETEPTETIRPTTVPTTQPTTETNPQPTEPQPTVCTHKSTWTRGKKTATYFEKGYTGDKICNNCGKVVAKGKPIAKNVLATPKTTIKLRGNSIVISYTKVKNAKGFIINCKFGSQEYTKTVKTTKSKTIRLINIKRGIKATVKVRAYTTSGKRKAYSNFTKAKTLRVK